MVNKFLKKKSDFHNLELSILMTIYKNWKVFLFGFKYSIKKNYHPFFYQFFTISPPKPEFLPSP